MEVKLDRRYPLAVDAGRAWSVLRDIRAVASAMPGAEITADLGDDRYQGNVKVKVGPATAQFGGEVRLLEIDPAAQRIRLDAKGADKGGSTASMDLTASIEAVDATTSELVGGAAVIVNGKFAQFGGRLMGQVSDMVLGQFAKNFEAAAAALPVSAGAGVAAPSPTAPSSPERAKELNALSVAWSLVRNWFLGLFRRRAG